VFGFLGLLGHAYERKGDRPEAGRAVQREVRRCRNFGEPGGFDPGSAEGTYDDPISNPAYKHLSANEQLSLL
jgi:hypothetical protein